MIPDRETRRWFHRKSVSEAFTVGPPVLVATATGLLNLQDPARRTLGAWLLFGAAWLLLGNTFKVAQAHKQDRERKASGEYDGLRAALHILHDSVCALSEREGGLRVAIHRVVYQGQSNTPEEIEQLLPYVGGDGGGPGRRFSIRSGILGRATREQKMIAVSRQSDDPETFMAELVSSWGYTAQEARDVRSDRRSWCAVPILDLKQNTTAVIFLDSTLPDYFTDGLQDLIAAACLGITTYIRERY